MNGATLGVMLAFLGAASPSDRTLELRLTTDVAEQLPYLYPEMQLEIVNTSGDVVLFPMNAFHVLSSLESEDGWRECRPLVVPGPAPLSTIEWKQVSPGEAFPVGIPGSRCAEGRGAWFEWANEPGTHRVKATVETYAYKVEVPTGAYDGVLESNVLEFLVKEPTGVNAEAIAWANGSPMKRELLEMFPSSEYAAFFVYGKSRGIDEVEPAKISSLIERGLFPGPGSIPSADGWQSVDGKAYARWQVEWGNRVLRDHPTFPFREKMRVSIALNQMSLGEKAAALEALTDIAEKGSANVAEWVRAFLDAESRE